MKLKTYHAFSMTQALDAVKADLGADAVILHTRTFTRRRWLGLVRTMIVEVTATTADHSAVRTDTRSTATARKPNAAALAAQRAYRAVEIKPKANITATGGARSTGPSSSEPTLESDRDRTIRLAKAIEEAHRQKAMLVGTAPTAQPSPVQPAQVHAKSKPTQSPPSIAPAAAETNPAPAKTQVIRLQSTNANPNAPARRFRLTTSNVCEPNHHSMAQRSRTTEQRQLTPGVSPQSAISEELSAIRKMVGQVLQHQHSSTNQNAAQTDPGANELAPSLATPTLTPQLFDLYLRLIAQEMSEELADRIIQSVRSELDGDAMDDSALVREAVLRHLVAHIPVANDDPPTFDRSSDGRPFIIALIGPTGVGKTTTLAKLAATFKLRQNRRVGLITADTYRIAAVDQLRTYAEIIDVPLHVACSPGEMKRAIAVMADRDVILIDTAGRSQKDGDRLAELRRFIAAANPDEVHLVLSATASEKVLLQEATAFCAALNNRPDHAADPTHAHSEQHTPGPRNAAPESATSATAQSEATRPAVHRIVLTKLDEAVSFGMLISVLNTIGRSLSYVTTGQEVPDDIEAGPGMADRLAAMTLGDELNKSNVHPRVSAGRMSLATEETVSAMSR